MVLGTKNRLFNDLERCLHSLMLKSKFLKDVGLFDGKTGIAITYAEVAKSLSNEVYYDCMSDILDDVLLQVNRNLGIGLASGLSGIGWGIEYLIQNKFVEGESVDICEELDNKIMETDPRRISDISLDKGFEGLLHYIISHLQGTLKQKSHPPFDNSYLSDMYYVCLNLRKRKEEGIMLRSLVNIYCSFYETGVIKNYDMTINIFLPVMAESTMNTISSCPLGLRNGLAGNVLRMITIK